MTNHVHDEIEETPTWKYQTSIYIDYTPLPLYVSSDTAGPFAYPMPGLHG